MTPSDAHIPGSTDLTGVARPAAPLFALSTLTKRADFLALARARRAHAAGFVLQARAREHATDAAPRIGFTCSKKVGNAVARNRAKRRLREIARQVVAQQGRPGWDYVLIGRKDATAQLPFNQLCSDLAAALAKVHRA